MGKKKKLKAKKKKTFLVTFLKFLLSVSCFFLIALRLGSVLQKGDPGVLQSSGHQIKKK